MRSASAACSPAREAPTITARPLCAKLAAVVPLPSVISPLHLFFSPADADSLHGAGSRRPLHLPAQRIVGGILVLENFLAAQLEHGRRGEDALAVGLAPVQVNHYPHTLAPSFRVIRSIFVFIV